MKEYDPDLIPKIGVDRDGDLWIFNRSTGCWYLAVDPSCEIEDSIDNSLPFTEVFLEDERPEDVPAWASRRVVWHWTSRDGERLLRATPEVAQYSSPPPEREFANFSEERVREIAQWDEWAIGNFSYGEIIKQACVDQVAKWDSEDVFGVPIGGSMDVNTNDLPSNGSTMQDSSNKGFDSVKSERTELSPSFKQTAKRMGVPLPPPSRTESCKDETILVGRL